MSEWDKLWEVFEKDDSGNIVSLDSELSDLKRVGDKLQMDLTFWQEACAEIQLYKDGLYDKLEAIREIIEDNIKYEDTNHLKTYNKILEVLGDE